MHPKACKATECWRYGRRSCFVTFLALIPKLAIRVRRDEANRRNDSSPVRFRDMHPTPIGVGCMSRNRTGELSLRRLASSRLTLMANFGIKARKVTKHDLRPYRQHSVALHAFGCMEMHPQGCKASFHEHFFAETQGLHCKCFGGTRAPERASPSPSESPE